jgi:hypothetical protein
MLLVSTRRKTGRVGECVTHRRSVFRVLPETAPIRPGKRGSATFGGFGPRGPAPTMRPVSRQRLTPEESE